MPVSNGRFSKPIRLKEDLANFFGLSANLGYIIVNGNINKWAKYKPVKIDRPFINLKTETINVTSPITGLLISVPAYYGEVSQETRNVSTSEGDVPVNIVKLGGFEIPELVGRTIANALSVINSYSTNGCNWNGESRSNYPWYRSLDFDGYYHNAVSPFYFQAPESIYSDDSPIFYFGVSAATSDQWGFDDMKSFLSDKYQYAVVVKRTSTGETYQGLGDFITSGLTSGNITFGAPLEVGSYTAYFLAIDSTNNRILLMPNTAECPNPLSFKVKGGSTPGSNPMNGVTITPVGFAYSYDYSYWELFTNVQEGDYVTLNTTGKYSIKQTWEIASNKAPAIDFGLLKLVWGSTGANNNHNVAKYRVFINGQEYSNNSTYVFQAGQTYSMIFEIENIFKSEDGSSYSPSQGEQFTSDQIELTYESQTQWAEATDITYDPSHNGQFYNSTDGYYTSR